MPRSAVIEKLLVPQECEALTKLYPKDGVFRSRVVMARHGFGRGEYKYFSYPLPGIIADLRASIYFQLAPIANRWNEAMDIQVHFPAEHGDFIRRCHEAGMTGQSSTPLESTRWTRLRSPPKVPVPGDTSFARIQSQPLRARFSLA